MEAFVVLGPGDRPALKQPGQQRLLPQEQPVVFLGIGQLFPGLLLNDCIHRCTAFPGADDRSRDFFRKAFSERLPCVI